MTTPTTPSELADRLEALAADLPKGLFSYDDEAVGQVNNSEGYHVASFSGTVTDWLSSSELFVLTRNNLPVILAALRQTSTDDAFRRGAEAMREAASALSRRGTDVRRSWIAPGDHDPQIYGEMYSALREAQEIERAIRALPIPEPKP